MYYALAQTEREREHVLLASADNNAIQQRVCVYSEGEEGREGGGSNDGREGARGRAGCP